VQNTGSGSVVLGPGFSPPSLTVLTSAVGDVLAYGINATRAAVTAQGWVMVLQLIWCRFACQLLWLAG
jgi:hypothetical protein